MSAMEEQLIAYYEAQLTARHRSGRLGRRILIGGIGLAVLALFVCGGMVPAVFGSSDSQHRASRRRTLAVRIRSQRTP